MNTSKQNLFDMLLKDNGKIVSSSMVSANDIAFKRACGYMHVDEKGFGYVYITQKEQQRETEELIRKTIQYVKNECCLKSIDEINEADAIIFLKTT